jgi:phosphomannomutase
MLYFSVQYFQADGGIMITGSHNPPLYNGFKMMGKTLPVFGNDILKLAKIAEEGRFVEASGSVTFEDVHEDYLKHLLRASKESNLKVAWDAGNGAAGQIMTRLTSQLPGEHILLNEVIDGSFPSHHPDPSVQENMQQLIDVVIKQNCDFGIAFDGDGDRIGVVDNKGRMLYGDHLLWLYSEDILINNPGKTIVADVKTSQVLYDEIAKNNGRAIMWKTGHSLIKTKMAEENAILGGEMSGHIFFAENFGFDDALFAAVKLLNIVEKLDFSLSQKIDQFPKTYSTPEIRVYVDEAVKFSIVEKIKIQAIECGLQVNDIDGVRAKNEDGWWLVRASNTEAALVMRCESISEDGLASLKRLVFDLLKQQGVNIA